VQLIDATATFTPLRKNLGKKNCELAPDQIRQITDLFLGFQETQQSKVFPNAAFGYWKIVVERPLRLRGIEPDRAYSPREIKALLETHERSEDGLPVVRRFRQVG
jgi:type I restriction enzyme M protein